MPIAPERLAAHRALIAKVDRFAAATFARRAGDIACRAGCSACCRVDLTVCDVEAAIVREGLAALEVDARTRIAERAATERGDRCAMLEDDGRCAVYSSRPLVCRTQGLPLRYEAGTIPERAILGRARGSGDPLTWCPLNFERSAPEGEDVLDAARVDAMLALSNREAGGDPERRTSIASLGREAARAGSIALGAIAEPRTAARRLNAPKTPC
jgi:Fe-S-cluster containining protein